VLKRPSLTIPFTQAGIPPGEIVLVPRSKGGFTYGLVYKPMTMSCVLSDQPRHQVPAIRTLLEQSTPENPIENPLHKDLLLIFLGRLNYQQGGSSAISTTKSAPNISSTASKSGTAL